MHCLAQVEERQVNILQSWPGLCSPQHSPHQSLCAVLQHDNGHCQVIGLQILPRPRTNCYWCVLERILVNIIVLIRERTTVLTVASMAQGDNASRDAAIVTLQDNLCGPQQPPFRCCPDQQSVEVAHVGHHVQVP